MKNYIVMDGRAAFDMESACVIESFGKKNDDAARKYFKREYEGYDAVLIDQKEKIISIQG